MNDSPEPGLSTTRENRLPNGSGSPRDRLLLYFSSSHSLDRTSHAAPHPPLAIGGIDDCVNRRLEDRTLLDCNLQLHDSL